MSNASSDARSITPSSPRSYARTYVRTDIRTGDSPLDQSFSNTSPAKSAKTIIEVERGQTPARFPDSERVIVRHQPAPVEAPDGQARPLMLLFFRLSSRGCSVSSFKKNAQSFAGAPLTREKIASCTNSATRRVQAYQVDARRHHIDVSSRVACSPIARWRGESDGSNPLRRPTNFSAADRALQYDRACLISPNSLPLVASRIGLKPVRDKGFSVVPAP